MAKHMWFLDIEEWGLRGVLLLKLSLDLIWSLIHSCHVLKRGVWMYGYLVVFVSCVPDDFSTKGAGSSSSIVVDDKA